MDAKKRLKKVIELFNELDSELIKSIDAIKEQRLYGGIVYANSGCWNESCTNSNNGCHNWTCSGTNKNCTAS